MGTDCPYSTKYQCIPKHVAPILISPLRLPLPEADVRGRFRIRCCCSPGAGQHRVLTPEPPTQLQPGPAGRHISVHGITSEVSEISISSSLLHPTNPELREGWSVEQCHKSRPLVWWLMRPGGEKHTQLSDPWPFAPCYCSGLAEQRLTRCSSCKRASICHMTIFSALDGEGELHSSAVLWRGRVSPAPCAAVNAFPSFAPELPAAPALWSWWGCQAAGHWPNCFWCAPEKIINKSNSPVSLSLVCTLPENTGRDTNWESLKLEIDTCGDFASWYLSPY